MDRERRKAENEAAFRRVNEEIAGLARRFDLRRLDLVCECSDAECFARLTVSDDVYERVRSTPTQFVIVPGHETAGVDRVVEATDDYTIVAKSGEAAEVAAETDPRA